MQLKPESPWPQVSLPGADAGEHQHGVSAGASQTQKRIPLITACISISHLATNGSF